MKFRRFLKLILWGALLLLPALAACAGSQPEAAAPAMESHEEAEMPASVEEEAMQIMPAEEEEVQKVAGKPKLVEFYADW